MKKNFYMKNQIASVLKNSPVLPVLLLLASGSLLPAQTCPDLPGGFGEIVFAEPVKHIFVYPGAIPAGAPTPARGMHTAGSIYITDGNDLFFSDEDPQLRTIIPSLDGDHKSKVVLQFFRLELEADAVLRIYNNSDASGIPAETIDASNQGSWIGRELVYDGEVTLSFAGSTRTEKEFSLIRYLTGDRLLTSCINERTSAIWNDFIQPDSYIPVDDAESDWLLLPVCMAYFDADKNYDPFKSGLSFCLRAEIPGGSLSYKNYPGEIVFKTRPFADFPYFQPGDDFDYTGRLKVARAAWLVKKGIEFPEEWGIIQNAIHVTLLSEVDFSFPEDTWEHMAQQAVSTLDFQEEPDFSLNVAGPLSAEAGETITISIPFELNHAPGAPQRLKLEFSRPVTISGVENGTIDADNILQISSSPVLLTLHSDEEGPLGIAALYDEEGYYKTDDLVFYEACDNENIQPFLGISPANPAVATEYAIVEWTPVQTPVTLVDFSAVSQEGGVRLNWETSWEQSSAYFSVERSPDGRRFSAIGTVAAAGDSETRKTYTFSDQSPLAGINYYRLRQIDTDGTFSLSGIISVRRVADTPEIVILGNPVSDKHVRLALPPELRSERFYLTDANGREVSFLISAGDQEIVTLKLPKDLGSGIYFLRTSRSRPIRLIVL